jgi:hypothetical protein
MTFLATQSGAKARILPRPGRHRILIDAKARACWQQPGEVLIRRSNSPENRSKLLTPAWCRNSSAVVIR